ncbi:MAG: tail fiber protein [Proteobacteria bacterium]|nr:tail fiber protein [Pseudomonadota bacterium]
MESYIGQIALFPYSFAPSGWAPCAGQILPIPRHIALFGLLGTNFGGDGRQTFALPDLRGKEPLTGTHYCIALEGIFPSAT